MSTNKTTTQTASYNPASETAFNALTPQVQANYTNDMQLDPTKSQSYNLGLQNMRGAANQISQRNTENFFGNLKAGGYAGNNLSGVKQAGMTGLGYGSSLLSSNAFNQNFMNYDMLRRQTTGQAAQYKPLQTGQTTTEKTSGLGTWLPQVIGAGVGAAGAFMTGGASMAMKAGGSALSAGSSALGSIAPSGTQMFGSGVNGGGGGFNPSFGMPSNYGTNPFGGNSFGSAGSVWGGSGH